MIDRVLTQLSSQYGGAAECFALQGKINLSLSKEKSSATNANGCFSTSSAS